MPSASWACSWKTCADSNRSNENALYGGRFRWRSGKSVRPNKAAKALHLAALAKPGLRLLGGRGGRSSVSGGRRASVSSASGSRSGFNGRSGGSGRGGAEQLFSLLAASGQGHQRDQGSKTIDLFILVLKGLKRRCTPNLGKRRCRCTFKQPTIPGRTRRGKPRALPSPSPRNYRGLTPVSFHRPNVVHGNASGERCATASNQCQFWLNVAWSVNKTPRQRAFSVAASREHPPRPHRSAAGPPAVPARGIVRDRLGFDQVAIVTPPAHKARLALQQGFILLRQQPQLTPLPAQRCSASRACGRDQGQSAKSGSKAAMQRAWCSPAQASSDNTASWKASRPSNALDSLM